MPRIDPEYISPQVDHINRGDILVSFENHTSLKHKLMIMKYFFNYLYKHRYHIEYLFKSKKFRNTIVNRLKHFENSEEARSVEGELNVRVWLPCVKKKLEDHINSF